MKIKLLCLFLLTGTINIYAQTGNYLPPVNFTAEQDHANMMKQLGIKALRPGPSGDEKAPNHANYNQALANPYPDYPDILTLKNGKKVTTPEMWWKQRRPEIAEDFEREVYGRIPKDVPKVTWTVKITDHEFIGFTPVIAKQLAGHVDNSAYPLLNVDIAMTMVLPANAKGPVPVLMMFGQSAFPAPAQPSKADLEKINNALKDLLVQSHPDLKEVFERYPAYNPISAQTSSFSPFAQRGPGDPPAIQQLIADGWGCVLI
ncbi:MAG: acetylxylan esterase, partial [Mucilaginibacter sp.]